SPPICLSTRLSLHPSVSLPVCLSSRLSLYPSHLSHLVLRLLQFLRLVVELNPTKPNRTQQNPTELNRTQQSSTEPNRAQQSPTKPNRTQQNPTEPNRTQQSSTELNRDQQNPTDPPAALRSSRSPRWPGPGAAGRSSPPPRPAGTGPGTEPCGPRCSPTWPPTWGSGTPCGRYRYDATCSVSRCKEALAPPVDVTGMTQHVLYLDIKRFWRPLWTLQV
uniref:Uncharacterized protein n=1 Tax=Cyclopterus lumpus TaxID=8103 RepID=A0A8C2Z0R2_CYCLU